MKKHLAIFSVLTAVLIYACAVVKSSYFNHPYPNIIEYIATIILLVYTIILLFWKNNRIKKAILGAGSIVILMLFVNLLTFYFDL